MDLSGGGGLLGGGNPVVSGSPESAKAQKDSYPRPEGPPEDGSGRRPGCLRLGITVVGIAVVLALAIWGLGEISTLIG